MDYSKVLNLGLSCLGNQQKVGIWPPYRYKDFRTGFYKSTDRAKAGTMMQDRLTRPFVESLLLTVFTSSLSNKRQDEKIPENLDTYLL